MAESTGIEWCDATFNPWWGCERVSPGCAHCYADTLATRYGFGETWGTGHGFRFFGDKHWDEPLKWARTLPAKLGRRPRVFCASMADVFEDRPELVEPRRRLFTLIEATPELDWLILTKRPEIAREWVTARWRGIANGETIPGTEGSHVYPYPPNVWLGVSIENARYTWRADVLREIPAAVRFISAEPLLGSLFDFKPTRGGEDDAGLVKDQRRRGPLSLDGIDWIIVGGESGHGARRFHLEHAREIVAHAALYALEDRPPAVFVKQFGAKPLDVHPTLAHPTNPVYAPLQLRDRKGGDWDEWPADLRIREFPRSGA